MTDQNQQPQTLIIDGVSYELSRFSNKVKSLVSLREVWSNQASVERAALTKTDAAIRQLDTELLQMVQEELKAEDTEVDK